MATGRGAQIFRVATTYIGTVVGAGFASGQETLRFFAAYGPAGLAGIVLSTVLFCALGIIAMNLGTRLRAETHREILHHVLGVPLGRVMDGAITLFLGITLTVMVAGGGAIFAQQFAAPFSLGTLFTAVVAGATILAGMRGVMAANTVVVPLLTIAVLGLVGASLQHHGFGAALSSLAPDSALAPVRSWWMSALLYVSYNLVLSLSVLGPLGAEVNNRATLMWGGLLGGLALGLMAAGMTLAISAHLPEAAVEIPMLYLTRFHGRFVQWFYALVLWAEIYTTAVACAYGFAGRLGQVWRYREAVVASICLALVGSSFGFSQLLALFYPLFGLVALVVLAGLVREPIRGTPRG